MSADNPSTEFTPVALTDDEVLAIDRHLGGLEWVPLTIDIVPITDLRKLTERPVEVSLLAAWKCAAEDLAREYAEPNPPLAVIYAELLNTPGEPMTFLETARCAALLGLRRYRIQRAYARAAAAAARRGAHPLSAQKAKLTRSERIDESIRRIATWIAGRKQHGSVEEKIGAVLRWSPNPPLPWPPTRSTLWRRRNEWYRL